MNLRIRVICLPLTSSTPFNSLEKMRGGSQSSLIRGSDDKFYVVKVTNNQQGLNVLANEVLGNELLRALNLPTPQWKMVSISKQFIAKTLDCRLRRGQEVTQFRADCIMALSFWEGDLTQIYEWLPGSFRQRIVNLDDFLGIYLFDLCFNHCDCRQTIFATEDDGTSFQAIFIDNGHLFGGPDWNRERRRRESLCLNNLFHTWEWPDEAVESWISRFETKYSASLADVARHVPKFWYSGEINSIADSSLRRLRMLRTLFAEELN